MGTESWNSLAAEDIVFLDEGAVAPGRVPILDALRDPSSLVGEELRLLRTKVLDICRQRRINCLAMASALPGEGKSTLAVGLAGALARQPGARVLLIEVDLRRPSLVAALGLSPHTGLGDWLQGQIGHLPTRFVDPGGFSLLVAGLAPLERPEVLGSPRMDALLRAARSCFDFVVLDAMPILPVADATLIQNLVDGFLIVVRYRQTPRDAVQKALARLSQARILGLILNDYREIVPSYAAHAYSRYGMTNAPSGRQKDRLSVGRKKGP